MTCSSKMVRVRVRVRVRVGVRVRVRVRVRDLQLEDEPAREVGGDARRGQADELPHLG